MKKFLVLTLCFVMMMSLNTGFAANETMDDWAQYVFNFYEVDSPSFYAVDSPVQESVYERPKRTYQQYVLEWKTEMVNTDFPEKVLRSHIRECEYWNGEPIGALGLEPTGGSKLRSTPDFSSSANIVGAISANKTIYIYFKVTNRYNKEWYYIVTDKGVEGFVAASRIQVIWI